MGAKSRRKGQRNECAIVNLLKAAGLEDACRVPLSGASAVHSGGKFAGDILVKGKRLEAKVRSSGFVQIYKWLSNFDGLVLKADRREPLITIRFADWVALLKASENWTALMQAVEDDGAEADLIQE